MSWWILRPIIVYGSNLHWLCVRYTLLLVNYTSYRVIFSFLLVTFGSPLIVTSHRVWTLLYIYILIWCLKVSGKDILRCSHEEQWNTKRTPNPKLKCHWGVEGFSVFLQFLCGPKIQAFIILGAESCGMSYMLYSLIQLGTKLWSGSRFNLLNRKS